MSDHEPMTFVDLWAAPIPGFFSVPEHHWFVVGRYWSSGCRNLDRWEVWQTPRNGDYHWGHLHKNLLQLSAGMGNGAAHLIRRWQNEESSNLIDRIESSPDNYPYLNKYRYWPGPNSNTYVQWVLENEFRLGWRGFGKRYPIGNKFAIS